MKRIDNWLEAKYTGGTPGPDRHESKERVFHASSIGKCPRQNYYKRNMETSDEWSPYFELGNQFEFTYGAALAWWYGNFSPDDLKRLDNSQIIEMCNRVVQDVTCTIEIDDITITGEADWVILKEGEGEVSHVELRDDGSRRIDYTSGAYEIIGEDEDTPIERVIETKTTKKISWRKKYGHKTEHQYQVGTYMWAFQSDGEIAYMTRNELDEMIFEFEYVELDVDNFFEDIQLRAQMMQHKLNVQELPEADPPRDNVCKYCDFKTECKSSGGKRWNDD